MTRVRSTDNRESTAVLNTTVVWDDLSPDSDAGFQRECVPKGQYEIISDELPHFKRFGNVHHYRYDGKMNTGGWSHRYYPSNDGTYYADNLWYSAPIEMLKPLPSLGSYTAAELVQEAVNEMQPSLSSGLSLSNFLLELGDIKQMFKLWRGKYPWNKGFSVKDLLRNIAGANLNYQFGWKLFIKDVVEMHNKLAAFDKVFRDFKSRIGKVQKRHFHKVITSGTDRDYTTQSLTNDKWVDFDWNVEFRATMLYTYSVPRIDSKYAELLGYLDVLGLKANLSVLWEALPYSFVVDWFLGVGNFFQQFDTDYLESNVTIIDFCYSILRTQEQRFTLHWHWVDQSKTFPLGTVLERDYTRKRCIPSASILGIHADDRFGYRQVGLAASLLLA